MRPCCVSHVSAARSLIRSRKSIGAFILRNGFCKSRSHTFLARSIIEHQAVLGTPRASLTTSTGLPSPSSAAGSGGVSTAGGVGSGVGVGRCWPAWSDRLSRRSMSTRKPGEDPASVELANRYKEEAVERPKEPSFGKGQDLMSDDPDARPKCVISGYDSWGFQLTDGVDVRGSMIALPNSYVLWSPKRFKEITIESLLLVELVRPKIDLLLIGVGERMVDRLDVELLKHLSSKGIKVEQLDTVNACSTFNVLNAEDRRVAAALLQLSTEPEPRSVDFLDSEKKDREDED